MRNPLALTGVSETLLIPLCARWLETQRDDAIIKDEKAGELVSRIDCDPERYRHDLSQVGIAVRTKIIDAEVRGFMQRRGAAVVVNLGAGLCTRFYRVDDGLVEWVELDLPEVADVWQHLFSDNRRHHRLSGSVLDPDWMDDVERIASGKPILFVAEGLLMYFRVSQVKTLIRNLSERFRGSEMILEAMSPLLAMTTLWNPAVVRTGAVFRWGITSTRRIARWAPGITHVAEWDFFDHHLERWGPCIRILRNLPFYQPMMMIGHLRFTGATA